MPRGYRASNGAAFRNRRILLAVQLPPAAASCGFLNITPLLGFGANVRLAYPTDQVF